MGMTDKQEQHAHLIKDTMTDQKSQVLHHLIVLVLFARVVHVQEQNPWQATLPREHFREDAMQKASTATPTLLEEGIYPEPKEAPAWKMSTDKSRLKWLARAVNVFAEDSVGSKTRDLSLLTVHSIDGNGQEKAK
jgi:hypothetical protein